MKNYHLTQLHKYLVNVTFEKFASDVYPDLTNECSLEYRHSKFDLFLRNTSFFLGELDEERLEYLANAITDMYICTDEKYKTLVEKAKYYSSLEILDSAQRKEIHAFINVELFPLEYQLEKEGFERDFAIVAELIESLKTKIGADSR